LTDLPGRNYKRFVSRTVSPLNRIAALLAFAASAWITGCSTPEKPSFTMTETVDFGTTADGKVVKKVTLRNAQGSVARFTSYGAMLIELHVPGSHRQDGGRGSRL
jgi:hypothetical protein